MTAFSSPLGAVQPHTAGVRLGKCQASRKVYCFSAPGAMLRCKHTDPIALRVCGSGPTSPSAEKSPQKTRGLAHHFARAHPLKYDSLPSPASSTASANDPVATLSAASEGLVMNRPCTPGALRNSLRRASLFTRDAAPGGGVPTGLSMLHAIETAAGAAPVFFTL